MHAQRERARAAARRGDRVDDERIARFARSAPPSEFVGYDELDVETRGARRRAASPRASRSSSSRARRSTPRAAARSRTRARSRRTPCAARSSRSTGSTATRRCSCGWTASCAPGDTRARARRRRDVRRATMANHTGTHLLQRALRNHLGEHVQQAGSAVRPEGLRFDFTHPSPLTRRRAARGRGRGQPRRARGSRRCASSRPRRTRRAMLGATMLFGEKYGDVVRVVDITGYSMELCGGTHAPLDGRRRPVHDRARVVGRPGRAADRGDHRARGAGRAAARRPRRARRRRPRCAPRPSSCPRPSRRSASACASSRRRRAPAVARRQRRRARPRRADRRRGRARAAQGARRPRRLRARSATRCSSWPTGCAARSGRRRSCSARATASACSSSRA